MENWKWKVCSLNLIRDNLLIYLATHPVWIQIVKEYEFSPENLKYHCLQSRVIITCLIMTFKFWNVHRKVCSSPQFSAPEPCPVTSHHTPPLIIDQKIESYLIISPRPNHMRRGKCQQDRDVNLLITFDEYIDRVLIKMWRSWLRKDFS